jgi:hypothetical protein
MFPSPAYLYATSNVAWQWIYTHPFLLFTFLVTCKLLSTRYSRGLREIPGPLLASFTNLWRFNVVRREDMPWTSIRLHEELGPLVRMGPNHVSVTHPDALRIIYGPDNTFQKIRVPYLDTDVPKANHLIVRILPHCPSSVRGKSAF